MQLLDDATITGALSRLSWNRRGRELIKVVRRQDFASALAYVNEVGRLAEEAGHHPDVEISWDTVTLRLSTHSLGGITDADLSLAARIDRIA